MKAENRKDFIYFRDVILGGDFDNRSLEVDLQMSLGIPPENINVMTELSGLPQYYIRYNNILAILYWDEPTMNFIVINWYFEIEDDCIVGIVECTQKK